MGTSLLLDKKRGEWYEDEERNMFATHQRVEQLTTTFDAAGHNTKRPSVRRMIDDGAGLPGEQVEPAGMDASGRPDGGQPLQAGRKPNGPFNQGLEAGGSTVRKTHYRWYPNTPSDKAYHAHTAAAHH